MSQSLETTFGRCHIFSLLLVLTLCHSFRFKINSLKPGRYAGQRTTKVVLVVEDLGYLGTTTPNIIILEDIVSDFRYPFGIVR